MKVLIADKSDAICEKILKENGLEVDTNTGLTPDQLKEIIGQYDAVIIRSATTLTKDILEKGTNLKAVARAGIGVDNIDVPAATEKKILVMNTPYGNARSTAEHSIALMFALARQIPQANASTHAGKWEKNKFKGVELYEKTLGLIGAGTIGSIVGKLASALGMKVIAYSPSMTAERAAKFGGEAVPLEELYQRADFISYHVKGNETTKNMLNKDAIAKMKKGVRIVNCARGTIMVEEDIKAALESGHIAGLATDVYPTEPATNDILFNMPTVIATPHIAASTFEAQVNVAKDAAIQIADYLLRKKAVNGVNAKQLGL